MSKAIEDMKASLREYLPLPLSKNLDGKIVSEMAGVAAKALEANTNVNVAILSGDKPIGSGLHNIGKSTQHGVGLS